MGSGPTSEGDLIARARLGDKAAFTMLVTPLRDEVTAHCYRMLGTLDEAEDVVQETLLRAWRAIDRFEDRGSFRPWLYRIATNRCLTHLRRSARRLETSTGDGSAEMRRDPWDRVRPYPPARVRDIDALDPEARLLARERIALAFVAALQHLSDRARAVLLLREVLGVSAVETAGLLDMTVAGVNSALQRARRTMTERVHDGASTEPVSTERASAQLRMAETYAAAWERGDIHAIVGMLTGDARYSMPPLPTSFTGRDRIRAFLVSGPLRYRWRFVPVQVNGGPAFGTYLYDEQSGVYRPAGLDVLILRGDRISEVVSFLDVPFGRFDLPETIAPDR